MSRNGSGTYSVPNTFVSGTTITASDHNENWSDLASEMTNSVAADGQTPMTGVLKLSNGAVDAPAITFSSDTDCGFYRIGANNIGLALNGAKVVDFLTTGVAVTGTGSFTGTLSATGDFAINTNKFNVTAATGNTTVAGTFGATGNSTIGGTLGVTGAATFSAATTINSSLTVTGNAAFSAEVSGATVAGNMRATQAQMEADSSAAVVVTPAFMKYSPWSSKAWGVFAGSNGALQGSGNISNITKNSTGNYTVSFATSFSSDGYAPVVQAIDGTGNLIARVDSQSTSQMVITIRNTSAGASDPSRVSFAVFGDFS